MTSEDFIAFEAQIAEDFEKGLIKAPVHLAGGNEQALLDIFKNIHPDDWVCGAWRTHLHCLLKGVPPDELRKAIHDGHSIALTFPKYKIISSAIVGGIAPIAMGIAWAIKKRGGKEKVWCFVGDMTAMSGIYHETKRYTSGHDLPIQFVIENNGKSVCTDTEEVWGKHHNLTTMHYNYQLTWPHVGLKKWVSF